MTARHPVRLVAILLAVVGCIPPVILYWSMVGRVPSVTPEAAKAILERGDDAVLVDVRTPGEFAGEHLDAACNWPYDEIAALSSAEGVPARLRGKRLLLVCQSGILSSLAAQRLRSLAMLDVVNVEGGMQAWVASGEKPCTLGLCRLRAKSGEVSDLPARPSTALEQWAAVATGFVVKPLYTTLALVLAVFLWRHREPDLAALRWALLCFFVGENLCAANYLVYGERSAALEYWHSYGMVLCFGLTIYAILEGIDGRLIKLGDPDARCAAMGLCRRCIKYSDVPCGLQRVFLFLIPAVGVVAMAPLFAEMVPVSYNTVILGTFYNYSHAVVHQIFEIRYLPTVAGILLLISLAVLRFKKREPVLWSKVFFAAGAGAMGFSFFRLVLLHAFRENLVWFAAWEEVTELLFILGVGAVLWIFRDAFALGFPVSLRRQRNCPTSEADRRLDLSDAPRQGTPE